MVLNYTIHINWVFKNYLVHFLGMVDSYDWENQASINKKPEETCIQPDIKINCTDCIRL